jgi:hypothetical protein
MGLFNLIPPQYRLLFKLVVLLVSMAIGGAIGSYLSSLHYSSIISNLKRDYAEEKEQATSELLAFRESKRIESEQVEKEYYEALKALDEARDTPKPINRLFDPGNKVCPSTLSSTNLHEKSSETGGSELSGEASAFLQSEADRADEALKRCNLFVQKTYEWASQQK